jgi:hypothetical protein
MLRLSIVTATLGALLFPASAAWATLPRGTWAAQHNGFDGDLVIDSVTQSPTNPVVYLVAGKLYGDKMEGSYNRMTGEVNLLRLIDPSDHRSNQAFLGTLSHRSARNVSQFTLVGTVYTFGGQKSGGLDVLRVPWRASITFDLPRREPPLPPNRFEP